MERPDAAGRGAGRWLCLEWQDLPQPLEDRPRHYRHPLERTPVLWFARQTVGGGAIVKAGGSKNVRCAIYTRVSTDQGLEQDFNSLDAQHDASQAYIRRKITVNEAEAACVQTIFQSYLTLGSLNLLMADLRARGIVTKVRSLKTGQTAGGIPFTRGPLAYLLRNRFYVGEVAFKGETLTGEQPAIVDRDLFDAVQAKLNEQVTNHKLSRSTSEALLLGRIYDDRGHRMTPSHVRKGAIKYRYYISSALLQGRAKQAGTISRIPAHEIEALVAKSVRGHLNDPTEIADAILVHNQVARVEVQSDRLVIELANAKAADRIFG